MKHQIYSEAWAAVRFIAPDLDPLEITNSIHLPSDTQHRRGEPNIRRNFSGIVRQYSPFSSGLWSMSSERWVQSPILEKHIVWLLEQLEPVAENIGSLKIKEMRIDIYCHSAGRSPSPPSISEETTSRAHALGIQIDIEHYDFSNEEDELIGIPLLLEQLSNSNSVDQAEKILNELMVNIGSKNILPRSTIEVIQSLVTLACSDACPIRTQLLEELAELACRANNDWALDHDSIEFEVIQTLLKRSRELRNLADSNDAQLNKHAWLS